MIDWSKLSPREIYDAKRTIPSLVAGPWELFSDKSGWIRRDANNSEEVAVIEWLDSSGEFCIYVLKSMRRYSTRKDADNALRDAGWILVDE